MSERDELRRRLIRTMQESSLGLEQGENRVVVDGLLNEIERTHVLVPVERTVLVPVERELLVRLLGRLASYADEYPGDDALAYYRLANEVESGARDRLTTAEFAGSGE